MNPNCKDCGKCCLNTEMVVSNSDIKNILEKSPDNIKKEEFMELKEDNLYHLTNIDGHCYFFDISLKLCKIYEFRPDGCLYYPMIYDLSREECILDSDCPRTHLFYQNDSERKDICIKIKDFLKNDLKVII